MSQRYFIFEEGKKKAEWHRKTSNTYHYHLNISVDIPRSDQKMVQGLQQCHKLMGSIYFLFFK